MLRLGITETEANEEARGRPFKLMASLLPS